MAKAKNGNGTTKPKEIEFSLRACKLGVSLNDRLELHGDDEVPAEDFSITAFLLAKDDLNTLTGDPHTHDALFDTKGNFKTPTDWVTRVSSFAFKDKFDNCEIAFQLGTSEDELVIAGVRIAKIRLEPRPGGFTEMTFQVQTTTDDDEAIMQIRRFRGREIEARLTLGNVAGTEKPADKAKKDQPELPMDHRADGEESRPH